VRQRFPDKRSRAIEAARNALLRSMTRGEPQHWFIREFNRGNRGETLYDLNMACAAVVNMLDTCDEKAVIAVIDAYEREMQRVEEPKPHSASPPAAPHDVVRAKELVAKPHIEFGVRAPGWIKVFDGEHPDLEYNPEMPREVIAWAQVGHGERLERTLYPASTDDMRLLAMYHEMNQSGQTAAQLNWLLEVFPALDPDLRLWVMELEGEEEVVDAEVVDES
jgi:hypothetical protein